MPLKLHNSSHCRWMNIDADLCSVKTTISRLTLVSCLEWRRAPTSRRGGFLYFQRLRLLSVFLRQVFDSSARDFGKRFCRAHLGEQTHMLVSIQDFAGDLVQLHIVHHAGIEGAVPLRQVLAQLG